MQSYGEVRRARRGCRGIGRSLRHRAGSHACGICRLHDQVEDHRVQEEDRHAPGEDRAVPESVVLKSGEEAGRSSAQG